MLHFIWQQSTPQVGPLKLSKVSLSASWIIIIPRERILLGFYIVVDRYAKKQISLKASKDLAKMTTMVGLELKKGEKNSILNTIHMCSLYTKYIQ